MRLLWAILLISLTGNWLYAQVGNLPVNFNINQEFESNLNKASHTSIKPLLMQFSDQESYRKTYTDTSKYYYWITERLYQKSLLEISKGDIYLTADPLIIYHQGRTNTLLDDGGKTVKNNTRGLRVTGDIGKNVSFITNIYENQFFLPNYLDSIVDARGVSFGLGRVKSFKTYGFDVGYSSGIVSVKTSKNTNIQFGHDKIFIGNGYRSLLVSDNSSNYPLLKFNWQSNNGKWRYQNTNAWMQNFYRTPPSEISPETIFKRKGATFRYLSFSASNKLEIGLFEGAIYENYNDTVGTVPMHFSFYTPILGITSTANGLNGKNNSLLGMNVLYRMKSTHFFGQIAMDRIDKYAFQVGLKHFAPFFKKDWIHVEFNQAPSFMYSHSGEFILQNYGHMKQELAHPIGASFKELIFKYYINHDHWFAEFNAIYSLRERREGSMQGENIFRANDIEDAQTLAPIQWDKVNTSLVNLEMGYEFNIKTRLQIFAGVYTRFQNYRNGQFDNQNETYWSIGIRTNLDNFYYDF